MSRLQGKVAIVTGASSGIGAAISQRFSKDGMKVVGFARRVERIEKLAKGSPGTLIGRKVDISSDEDIQSNIKWVTDNVGPVSVMVNNAGIAAENTLVNGDVQKWRELFNTNVLGLLVGCKEAINVMQKHNINGHIVNINSVAGHYYINYPNLNVYPATKVAVTNLTESIRRELAIAKSKIRITSISPGGVLTEIMGNTQDMSDWPLLKSDEVADAVSYVVNAPEHVNITELMIRYVGEHF